MTGVDIDPCHKCEELMQPYLDRELSEAERQEAEEHLARCGYCAKRYRFEESLRRYIKRACCEDMPPELKERLAALRSAP